MAPGRGRTGKVWEFAKDYSLYQEAGGLREAARTDGYEAIRYGYRDQGRLRRALSSLSSGTSGPLIAEQVHRTLVTAFGGRERRQTVPERLAIVRLVHVNLMTSMCSGGRG